MNNSRFSVHRRTQAAIDALTTAERKAVRAKLAELADAPIEQWPARGVLRISSQEPLYLARIDDSLCLILRGVEREPPALLDLVRHETLQWFRIWVLSRPTGERRFMPLRSRWLVERTFAWLGRYRRLSKDYEHLPESSEALVKIAGIHHYLRRLCPSQTARSQRFRFKGHRPKQAA